MLNPDDISKTFEKEVLVQFDQVGGTVKQGSFMAEFFRLESSVIDELYDLDDLRNSEVFDKAVKRVWNVGRSKAEELGPEESMALVRRTPECLSAAVTVFFRSTRPERYNEKTSRSQRKRG